MSTLKKWKFNFENNLRVKQNNFHRRCPIVLNKNFVSGSCEGRLGDDLLALPIELPLVGGIASIAMGIDAPACYFSFIVYEYEKACRKLRPRNCSCNVIPNTKGQIE